MRWVRDFYLKDTVRHGGLDARRVNPDWQLKRSVEYAVASFGQVVILALIIRLRWNVLFATDRENVLFKRTLDILTFESGQLGCDFNLLVGFDYVCPGRQTRRRYPTDRAETTGKLLHETADLTAEWAERVKVGPTGRRTLP